VELLLVVYMMACSWLGICILGQVGRVLAWSGQIGSLWDRMESWGVLSTLWLLEGQNLTQGSGLSIDYWQYGSWVIFEKMFGRDG